MKPCPYNVCGGSDDPKDEHEDCAIQRSEMKAEQYGAEAALGMRAGTTDGWYDEPYYEDPFYEEYDPRAYEE